MRASDYPYLRTPFAALAHRGGSLYPPNRGRENSMHAFATAVELGYRYLETDVHTTADGVPVLFHDEALDRVTDATGRLADLPWAEVSQARIGGVDPLPTLDELLESFPRTNINIDIKAPGAVAPLWHALERHRAQSRVCVGSFSIERIRAFRRLAGPSVATAASQLGVAWYGFAPLLRRAIRTGGVVLQVPPALRSGRVPLVTPGMVRAAHAAGRKVHVWTIDDRAEMERLLDVGVDGLVSDRIDVLKDVLVARSLWEDTQ